MEVVKADESYEGAFMITDEETVDVFRKAFNQVKWEPKNGKKRRCTTLFFKYDVNMPERLFVYQIWFNQSNDTATILVTI